MNPAFNKLAYQIISDAEVLFNREIFISHDHLLLYLSKSELFRENRMSL